MLSYYILGVNLMVSEDVIAKLKGVKALLYMCGYNSDHIEDEEYAFYLLAEVIDECLNNIKEDNDTCNDVEELFQEVTKKHNKAL